MESIAVRINRPREHSKGFSFRIPATDVAVQ
jgi:hypothetical protein